MHKISFKGRNYITNIQCIYMYLDIGHHETPRDYFDNRNSVTMKVAADQNVTGRKSLGTRLHRPRVTNPNPTSNPNLILSIVLILTHLWWIASSIYHLPYMLCMCFFPPEMFQEFYCRQLHSLHQFLF